MSSNVTDNTAYRIRHSAAIPATCSPGDTYVDDTGGGSGLYVCLVTNTWTGPYDTGSAGDVQGPASAIDSHLAIFDGATGKLIKDGGALPTSISGLTPNTLTKANGTGTGVVDSVATDIAGTLTYGPFSVVNGDTGSLNYDQTGDAGEVSLVVSAPDALNKITAIASTESLTIDGTAHTAAIVAASQINIDSKGGITNIGDVGGAENGTKLIVNDVAGEISTDSATVFRTNEIRPLSAPGGNVGFLTLPYTSVIIGNAANNSSQITGTFTGNRIATLPDATGTLQLVGAANTGAVLGIPINNTVLATATGTVYSSPGNDGTALSIATEGNVSFPITRAGTIRNFYVRTGGTAKTNTPTTVITIRKNGVDTAVTLTMTQTVNTTTSDITHSFTVVAGDLITVSFTTTGVAGVSTSIAGVSFEFD